MHYKRGMRGKLGCIDFAKLLVLRVARAEDFSGKSSRKGCEIGVAGFRDREPRDLPRKAGPRQERKRRTKAMPDERAPIHRCPCERWIWSQGPVKIVRQVERWRRAARWPLLSSGSYGITSPDYCVGKNSWALDDLDECIIANGLTEPRLIPRSWLLVSDIPTGTPRRMKRL
jgi:hypothetical protein